MIWFKTKGGAYTDSDVFNIRDYTIRTLHPIIDEYVDWYAEHGVSLPEAFALDPAGWTEVLRKIQKAFFLAATEHDEDSPIAFSKKHGHEEALVEYRREIQAAFSLFGKHLDDIVDKYGSEQDR